MCLVLPRLDLIKLCHETLQILLQCLVLVLELTHGSQEGVSVFFGHEVKLEVTNVDLAERLWLIRWWLPQARG